MKMEILLAVVPPYIGEYPQPEQYASRDLMDKQGPELQAKNTHYALLSALS
jgi:hypothetical protein